MKDLTDLLECSEGASCGNLKAIQLLSDRVREQQDAIGRLQANYIQQAKRAEAAEREAKRLDEALSVLSKSCTKVSWDLKAQLDAAERERDEAIAILKQADDSGVVKQTLGRER